MALSPKNLFQSEDIEIPSHIDNISRTMLSDVNQRVVKSTSLNSPMKIVLQEVNLMNMSSVYSPGGQALIETYQFMARDHYFTEADMSFIKQISADNISSVPSPDLSPEDSINYITNWGQTYWNVPVIPPS